jgi:antitoxin (DNA-binding transcriptional repressor) of toxin-antitoxin stability system
MTECHLTVIEARRHFGNLVLDALAGKTTIITRYGKSAAAITPVRGAGQSHTVDLPSGTSVTISISGPVLNASVADREWLFDLIDLFKKHEAKLAPTGESPVRSEAALGRRPLLHEDHPVPVAD